MKSDVRVGRLVGNGATINVAVAVQSIPGLTTTLDVPKGCVALITLSALVAPNGNTVWATLEIDGTLSSQAIQQGSSASVWMTGAQTYLLPPGRHALRVLTYGSTGAGQTSPSGCTLAWTIAPQGGIAN